MLDLKELKQSIRNMTRQQAIYRLLRDELTLQGHWKLKKRGKPNPRFKGQ
jgi:hypothetical protein